MDIHETHLLAACKTVAAFGAKYAADFPPATVGGQQFTLVSGYVPQEGDLGAAQISGEQQKKAGVNTKTTAAKQLHDDLLVITDAVHSLVLMGTPGLEGKFHLPRNHGAQDLLNAARAFKKDAAAFSAAMISLGLEANFIAHLDAHITDYENAIAAKGAGQSTAGGATGGLADTSHKLAVALHILNTVVRNKYKNDPLKLAEWVIASHVEKHTPQHRPQPPTPPPTPAPK